MSTLAQLDPEIDLNGDISSPTEDEIAALAHRLWIDRGRPIGSPDDDWLLAEAELRNSR